MKLSSRKTMQTSAFAFIVAVILCTNKYTVADNGTTSHIQEIFMGRCWEYQTFHVKRLQLSGWVMKNCTKLWQMFLQSFQKKTPCDVLPSDYSQYFIDSSPGMTPRNKAMFWSGTSEIAHKLSYINPNYITLEDTFPGYIANDLIWCEGSNKIGLNFTYCPKFFGQCTKGNSSGYAHWREASNQFALHAQGIAYVMVNGAKVNGSAYDPRSFFGSVELPNLSASLIDELKVYVIWDLDKKPKEKCGQLSLITMMKAIKKMGINATCEDNPVITLSILCDKYPKANQCRQHINQVMKQKKEWQIIAIAFIAATGILIIIILAVVIFTRFRKAGLPTEH